MNYVCVTALLTLASCTSLGSGPQVPSAPTFNEGPTPHILRADPAPAGEYGLDDLAFLVGHWEGEAFGGWAEESWGPAKAGSMLGSFRLVTGDRTAFYELLLLVQRDGRPVMRVKHFAEDLTPWEEGADAVDFELIRVEGSTAWFGGLTLARAGSTLVGYLAMSQGGEVSEATFSYQLVGNQ
ncbi:MAG: hypothetical protein ACI8QC_002714 [Planctomycetota bacterium]|jgi:hypothetical protein